MKYVLVLKSIARNLTFTCTRRSKC